MNALIDTSIWSIVLRRKKHSRDEEQIIQKFSELVEDFRAKIIGPIRQEILSGLPPTWFKTIKEYLDGFEDLSINTEDYERAAEMFSVCRAKGIQGSHIDYLICAVSERNHLPIYTKDGDFKQYKKYLPIILFE